MCTVQDRRPVIDVNNPSNKWNSLAFSQVSGLRNPLSPDSWETVGMSLRSMLPRAFQCLEAGMRTT